MKLYYWYKIFRSYLKISDILNFSGPHYSTFWLFWGLLMPSSSRRWAEEVILIFVKIILSILLFLGGCGCGCGGGIELLLISNLKFDLRSNLRLQLSSLGRFVTKFSWQLIKAVMQKVYKIIIIWRNFELKRLMFTTFTKSLLCTLGVSYYFLIGSKYAYSLNFYSTTFISCQLSFKFQ